MFYRNFKNNIYTSKCIFVAGFSDILYNLKKKIHWKLYKFWMLEDVKASKTVNIFKELNFGNARKYYIRLCTKTFICEMSTDWKKCVNFKLCFFLMRLHSCNLYFIGLWDSKSKESIATFHVIIPIHEFY